MEDRNNWFLVSHAVGPAGRVEHPLKDGENLVGRRREANVHLAHLDVSREHCFIFLANSSSSLVLVDKGSRNGTFVNGQKVCADKAITLFENDSVGFGSNTTVKETYADKTPFLVFRIVRKIPSSVFEELAMNRGKNVTKRQAETAPSCLPAIKRIKAEHGVAPAPIGSQSRPSTEVSSTVTTEEPPAGNQSSAGVQVTRARPDGLIEVCVIDDDDDDQPEPSAESSSVVNQSDRSKCGDQTKTQNSLLAKSTDSTLQNGVQSDMEIGTPSFQNNSSRLNDNTRSIQKNLSTDSSTAGSASKNAKRDPSPHRTSSSKAGLFKLPLMEVKRELRSGATPPPSPVVTSPALSNASKNGEFPTFSLISDDEDEDEMMSSQLFIKTEPESQNLVVGVPDVVDDEVYEISDDDESMFENHLSQSFSQSFMLPEEPLKGVEVVEEPQKLPTAEPPVQKKSKEKDGKLKKMKDSSEESLLKDPKLSQGPPSKKPSSSSKSVSKKTETKKSSKKLTKTESKKSRGKVEVAPKRSSRASSKEDPEMALRSKPVKESAKAGNTVAPASSSKDCRPSAPSSIDSAKTSKQPESKKVLNEVEKIVQKMIDDSKKKDVPKKAVLVEPHSLPVKEKSIGKIVAVSNSAVLPTKQRRVTFKENLTEVKEFECLGNMKKLSSVPTHLLKEHPPKLPALQWNSHLLRGCGLIGDICQWNLKWLQEFQTVEKDPPLIDYQPQPLANRFKDYRDYFFTMLALTMYELWSELCRTHLFQAESQQFSLFSGIIDHVEPNFVAKTMFCRVKAFSSPSDVGGLPNFGDLVGIEILAPDHKHTHLYSSFGIVTRQYSKERLQPSREANFLVKNLAPDKSTMDKFVCPIEILFRESITHKHSVTRDCFVRIRVYRNIMNHVKYFLALNKVRNSPLKSIILDPTKAVNRTPETRKEARIHGQEYLTTNLNQLQKEAVLGVANSVLSEDSSISLIHGPPGTGKSSTIASLVVHLLPILRKSSSRRKGPPPKILLCAPSNNAIDELCLKLLEVRKKLRDEEKFKLTRVGNSKMMHPLVAEISSYKLALRNLTNTPDPQSLETEMTLLAARIQAGKNSLIGSNLQPEDEQRIRDNIEKGQTRYHFYSKTLANIRSGRPPSNPEEDRKLFSQEESVIISGAEIIATTLSSSISKKISDAICDSNQFSCCIVDEATQATEPEVLIPLNHDIRHLVLVGDPQQLGPTVTSRFAKERNFEWSLYHRLMGEWKQYRGTPLYPLREQYRMHAEIVSFPSNKFYNGELTTPSYLKVDLPFSAYHVISHPWHESSSEESNEKEGRFIIELVQKLKNLPEFKHFEVGIIVPYQKQNLFMRKAIEDKCDRGLDNVVVNTIDSFQGQEKDLIVLSCVRTKRIGFLSDRQRLNVALTRAKRCLLVVGNFQALKKTILLKVMVSLRLGGPLCLVVLAWLCSRFSFEDYFALKYRLYVAYMSFNAISTLTLPVHAAVLLDQIVQARDFVLETAQIFTVWLVLEQLFKVVGAVIVYFTADDKISAAYAQMASPVFLFPITIYFLFATHRSKILVSPPVSYHGAFKVIGCGFDHIYRFCAKQFCRSNDPKSLSFSEQTRKNCKKLWSLQFALICLIPYFYFVDGVKFCLNCLEPIEHAILKERSYKELYQQLIEAAALILVQLFIFPITYKRKKAFFRLPVRRLYFTYLAVGVLGTVAFCMIIWNQKVGAERYVSARMSSISLHNMLNSTTTVIIEQSKILKPVQVGPYGRHLLSFDEPVASLNVELVNKFHFIEDYILLGVEGHSTYVLTVFGLERVEGVELHDTSMNPTKSVVNIICLMVICKGRGYVLIDCGGNFVVRPELVRFGKKVRLEVTRDSHCSAKLLTPKGNFVSEIKFRVDSPVISLASVDHNETHPYHLVRFHGSQPIPFDEWALMPVQVLSDVFHCLFFVALSQFLLLTAPKALRATTVATLFFYRFVAHVLISYFLCEGGSFSAVNCYVAIATFVISFLAFIYATTKFASYTLRCDLSPAESLDKARVQPFMSFESLALDKQNPETRSLHSISSKGAEEVTIKSPYHVPEPSKN